MQRIRVTGGLIEDDRLLLVRQRVNQARSWSLPGGSVEPGETLVDAVVREVAEETGLSTEVRRLLYVAELPEHGLVHITFELGRTGGELRLPTNEHDENPISDVRFVPIPQLCDYGFSETWRNLTCTGFDSAPSYVGHKRAIGL